MLSGLGQFCFPCTVTVVTRKPSPPCATGWSNTLPSPAQPSEASVCAAGCPEGASVEILPLATSCLLGGAAAGGEAGVGQWCLLKGGCCSLPTGKWFSSQCTPPSSLGEEFRDPRQHWLLVPWRGGLLPKALPGPAAFLGLAKPQVLCAAWKGRSQGCRPWECWRSEDLLVEPSSALPVCLLSTANTPVLHSQGPRLPKEVSRDFREICHIYNGEQLQSHCLERVPSLQPFSQAFHNSSKNWRSEIWEILTWKWIHPLLKANIIWVYIGAYSPTQGQVFTLFIYKFLTKLYFKSHLGLWSKTWKKGNRGYS